MNLHLAEIAKAVAPAAHSTRLVVPANITIIALPPKCPELNPVENVWQFMRDNWLSKPRLQILRRSRRPLLQRLEQARRSALAHHVHRTAPMGARVLINGNWYKLGATARERDRDPVTPL